MTAAHDSQGRDPLTIILGEEFDRTIHTEEVVGKKIDEWLRVNKDRPIGQKLVGKEYKAHKEQVLQGTSPMNSAQPKDEPEIPDLSGLNILQKMEVAENFMHVMNPAPVTRTPSSEPMDVTGNVYSWSYHPDGGAVAPSPSQEVINLITDSEMDTDQEVVVTQTTPALDQTAVTFKGMTPDDHRLNFELNTGRTIPRPGSTPAMPSDDTTPPGRPGTSSVPPTRARGPSGGRMPVRQAVAQDNQPPPSSKRTLQDQGPSNVRTPAQRGGKGPPAEASKAGRHRPAHGKTPDPVPQAWCVSEVGFPLGYENPMSHKTIQRVRQRTNSLKDQGPTPPNNSDICDSRSGCPVLVRDKLTGDWKRCHPEAFGTTTKCEAHWVTKHQSRIPYIKCPWCHVCQCTYYNANTVQHIQQEHAQDAMEIMDPTYYAKHRNDPELPNIAWQWINRHENKSTISKWLNHTTNLPIAMGGTLMPVYWFANPSWEDPQYVQPPHETSCAMPADVARGGETDNDRYTNELRWIHRHTINRWPSTPRCEVNVKGKPGFIPRLTEDAQRMQKLDIPAFNPTGYPHADSMRLVEYTHNPNGRIRPVGGSGVGFGCPCFCLRYDSNLQALVQGPDPPPPDFGYSPLKYWPVLPKPTGPDSGPVYPPVLPKSGYATMPYEICYRISYPEHLPCHDDFLSWLRDIKCTPRASTEVFLDTTLVYTPPQHTSQVPDNASDPQPEFPRSPARGFPPRQGVFRPIMPTPVASGPAASTPRTPHQAAESEQSAVSQPAASVGPPPGPYPPVESTPGTSQLMPELNLADLGPDVRPKTSTTRQVDVNFDLFGSDDGSTPPPSPPVHPPSDKPPELEDVDLDDTRLYSRTSSLQDMTESLSPFYTVEESHQVQIPAQGAMQQLPPGDDQWPEEEESNQMDHTHQSPETNNQAEKPTHTSAIPVNRWPQNTYRPPLIDNWDYDKDTERDPNEWMQEFDNRLGFTGDPVFPQMLGVNFTPAPPDGRYMFPMPAGAGRDGDAIVVSYSGACAFQYAPGQEGKGGMIVAPSDNEGFEHQLKAATRNGEILGAGLHHMQACWNSINNYMRSAELRRAHAEKEIKHWKERAEAAEASLLQQIQATDTAQRRFKRAKKKLDQVNTRPEQQASIDILLRRISGGEAEKERLQTQLVNTENTSQETAVALKQAQDMNFALAQTVAQTQNDLAAALKAKDTQEALATAATNALQETKAELATVKEQLRQSRIQTRVARGQGPTPEPSSSPYQ